MNEYLERLKAALAAEEEFAHNEHKRVSHLSYEDRIAMGQAFPPLYFYRWDGSDLLLKPRRSRLHDGIQAGDLIHLAPMNKRLDPLNGICTEIEDVVCVRLDSPPSASQLESIEKAPLCLSLRFDRRSFENYQKGLDRAIEIDTPLKNALLNPHEINTVQISEPWKDLNLSQSIAAETFLHSSYLSLIHGPPGTGKTHTLARIIQRLIQEGETPWALADSNAAVDNICLALARCNIDVLRMGSPFRISKETWHLSIWSRIDCHPQQPAIRKLEKEIRVAKGRDKRDLVREKRRILKQIRNSIIQEAPVIANTLGSMSKEALRVEPTRSAIIDEASQITDPAIWSIVPYIQRLLLVGDPHQLGPVVLSPQKRLKETLLQKKMHDSAAPMLEIQHRMSTPIMSLVAGIYGSNYTAHPSVAERMLYQSPPIHSNALTQSSVLWIDTSGAEKGEERDPTTRSLFNEVEIEETKRIVSLLRRSNVHEIGIIAPYSAQVQRLRELFPDIEVNTVNAFQGREKDVIICSFVRSNAKGELGFVADRNRLTVALTRAKRLWIGIGDASTLSYHSHFEALFDQIEGSGGTWASIWEPMTL
ncbi:MAG: AAA domain-containing protein [Myxococcota bacterium]|nr:AAA domain-containing protein [Myxococcota bacterium]